MWENREMKKITLLPGDERSESLAVKNRRALTGAYYGLLGGSALAACSTFLVLFLNPLLPLGPDWPLFWLRWGWIAGGLTVTGLLSAWWHESWRGGFSGALALTLCIQASLQAQAAPGESKIAALLIIILPMLAICLAPALGLRWLARWHVDLLQQPSRSWRIVLLTGLTLALGCIAGAFLRPPSIHIDAAQFVHQTLQDPGEPPRAFDRIPSLADQRGLAYQLYYAPSSRSTVGVVVRVVYTNGYVLTCETVLYPGTPPRLEDCQAQP